ncbi:hypothetical protein JX265_001866 [Neoarthrinium moseri]|uniref:Uncharacterized protein n=1 Tax=Neoarthrinium moseri TaxID=1658444 RepID=A0A9P9WW97_9PEZI|nr:uncharacterized protein JN550_005617 [Neoarthrinium moseri]KAI1843517.1 hypothetical protein JX266_010343 [Neoarthrinium moseri]KAI1869636.1 hypothetical protein JN550_005617 [Neoarthrinium moseri]KAI1880245.1 hypothetical protein JX265_001866 [Neoarthrinium moseri]
MASVNKPTDVKQKEADVNRKLQIYGIVNAFQQGKVPSNEQIDVALNSFLASKAIASPSNKLSTEGQALVADFRDVVNQAKNLLLSKNEGNLLQDFIWQTTQFDPTTVPTPNVPVDKDTAKQHGDKALEGLRTLGTLLITNGQFRKLLNDAVILFRDMAGDAAANAASKVKPSEDALAQIDRPADDNTWHDAPNLSKESVKAQLQSAIPYKGDAKKDAQAAANAGINAAQPSETGADPQSGVNAARGTATEQIKQNVPEETQQQAKENKAAVKETAAQYRERTKQYLQNKVPQERREQLVWRLKKMVLECQQHPDYQQAITTLLDLAEQYGSHGKRLTAGGTGTVQEARSGLAQAEADLKVLIERFANGTSSDDLWASIGAVYDDADRDPELKNWFKSLDTYVRRCLQQQGYILDEASNEEWNHLYDRGNYLLRQKYRGHTDRIVNEIKFLGHQFDEDPMNKRFATSVQKLFNDLGNDSNGKPTFKPHLIKDLTDIILPAAFENVAYIPIPRIEYSDSQIDAVVENLVLESDNFMPNVLEVASDNFFRWGRKKIANKNKNTIDIKVAGVQMDLRDVSYYVKRKQGFPSITDTGVANVFLGGDGFSFRMKLVTADESDKQHFFKIDKVDVDVKNLKIKLVKSNHKLLFGLAKPVMLKVLRPVIQKTAEKQLKEQFNQFDQLMYQVKLEADRALEEAREHPENASNIYQRYANALQKQVLQGKQKAEDFAADKKVNVAVTQEDSIFPNIKLPGGISSKATEYKELARKGEKWESPVFSIGGASKSSDIPKAPAVTRKPHDTTSTNGHVGGFANGNGQLNGNTKPLNGNALNGATYAPGAAANTVTI